MRHKLFIRNMRASSYLELFLVSAIASVLAIRFYLHIFNYPQIGGDSLHIAHMLWGGVLMTVAMVLLMAFLGSRIAGWAALIGGVGFGIFIDELGKFITRDHNYFYQPTIGLIYATFVILFLIFRYLGRNAHLSPKEYLMNALSQLEDVVLDDFDPEERKRVVSLLNQAGSRDPLAQQLRQIMNSAELKPAPASKFTFLIRIRNWLYQSYNRLLVQRYSKRFIKLFFFAEALIFLSSLLFIVTGSISDVIFGRESIAPGLLYIAYAEAISAGVAGLFVLRGVYVFTRSRTDAYQQFIQATLIQLLLTSLFSFYRNEFGAFPAFTFNLLLFAALRTAMSAERHLNKQD